MAVRGIKDSSPTTRSRGFKVWTMRVARIAGPISSAPSMPWRKKSRGFNPRPVSADITDNITAFIGNRLTHITGEVLFACVLFVYVSLRVCE